MSNLRSSLKEAISCYQWTEKYPTQVWSIEEGSMISRSLGTGNKGSLKANKSEGTAVSDEDHK